MTQTIQELAQEILRKRGSKGKDPPLRVLINPEPPPLTRREVAAFLAPCEPAAGDLDFLMGKLPVKSEVRIQTLEGYRGQWIASMESERKSHKKQNAGRRAANNWLRTGATP